MSAARHAYGLPDPAAQELPRRASGFLPLLVLVVALAAATFWFVGMPMLDRPADVKRTCEVVVDTNGKTKCVEKPGEALTPTKKSPGRSAKS